MEMICVIVLIGAYEVGLADLNFCYPHIHAQKDRGLGVYVL